MSLNSRRLFLLGSFSIFIACATIPATAKAPFLYGADLHQTAPFIEHEGSGKMQSYLVMNLPYAPVEGVRKELEKRLGRDLINRGEAHITVISPVEFDNALRAKISIKAINEIASAAAMQQTPVDFPCLGKGSVNLNGAGEQTYFLVAKAPRLLDIRKAVYAAFVKAGGDPNAFNPETFYPHVTVGFTKRDLHFEDGVLKDETSCFAPLIKATP